ncbi:MAG: ammonium transporter [Desulfuromonas sp.]|nr:ammonium transporter [Desulfuromonas sp.]
MELLQINLNYVWIAVCAFLVMFMQAGFMCLEAGLSQAKNSINIAIKNVADFILSVALFWAIGFGLMFGASSNGFIGTSHFLIDVSDPWVVLFFVFQSVFCGTATTIDSGALSGRAKFSAYLVASALISGLIYPIFGHWAWGGLLVAENAGWFEQLGFMDFAGSTVVHSVGGWVALAGIIVVGPRLGRFNEDGTTNRMSPHNMTFAYLGVLILFFSWFGFNCGSTLEAGTAIAPIALNTLLAAAFGGISSSAFSWTYSSIKRPEGEMIANGILGGLVAITAGCAVVDSWGAMLIGLVAGAVAYLGTIILERVLHLDDVVGAVPVHGFCGVWGTVATALFIRSELLEGASRLHFLGVQVLGVVVAFIWAFGISFVLFKLIDKFCGGMRVSAEDERLGLNIAEHGASSSLLDLVQAMNNATASGNFSDDVKVEVEVGTEMGDLAKGFNSMVDSVHQAMTETHTQLFRAEQARKKAEEAQKQALESSSEAQHQMIRAEKARQEAETAQKEITMSNAEREEQLVAIKEITQQLNEIMGDTEDSMNLISGAASSVHDNVESLNAYSQDIDSAIAQINKLAYSSRLLSLNAMVESAHAGDAGKTFIVVAEEMKNHSAGTEKVTDTIVNVIDGIQERLETTRTSVQEQFDAVRYACDKISQASSLVQALILGKRLDDLENEKPAEFIATSTP